MKSTNILFYFLFSIEGNVNSLDCWDVQKLSTRGMENVATRLKDSRKTKIGQGLHAGQRVAWRT